MVAQQGKERSAWRPLPPKWRIAAADSQKQHEEQARRKCHRGLAGCEEPCATDNTEWKVAMHTEGRDGVRAGPRGSPAARSEATRTGCSRAAREDAPFAPSEPEDYGSQVNQNKKEHI